MDRAGGALSPDGVERLGPMARQMVGFRLESFDGVSPPIIVAVHNHNAPSEEDWDEWASICEQALKFTHGDLSSMCNLVITDGGAPNAEQRTRITKILAEGYTQPRVAVVNDSAVVRLAVRAFSMFNRDTKAFAPTQFGEAVEHVRWQRSDVSRLLQIIEERATPVFGGNTLSCLRAIRAAHPAR